MVTMIDKFETEVDSDDSQFIAEFVKREDGKFAVRSYAVHIDGAIIEFGVNVFPAEPAARAYFEKCKAE